MARVRMIALAGLAACGRAEAVPPPAVHVPGVHVPTGWQALPALATAAETAAGGPGGETKIDSVGAWGDPARGCYALYVAVRGAADKPADLARELAGGLVLEPRLAGITVHELTSDATGASLAFEREPYRGKLRVRVPADAEGALAATACFWNDREPKACEAACAELLP